MVLSSPVGNFRNFVEDLVFNTCRLHPIIYVQMVKEKVSSNSEGSFGDKEVTFEILMYRVHRFLLSYRNTPHTTTCTSPAQMLFNRLIVMPLDTKRFRPGPDSQITGRSGKFGKHRTFRSGDQVWARDNRNQRKWLGGRILQKTGPLSNRVQVGSKVWCRQTYHTCQRLSI